MLQAIRGSLWWWVALGLTIPSLSCGHWFPAWVPAGCAWADEAGPIHKTPYDRWCLLILVSLQAWSRVIRGHTSFFTSWHPLHEQHCFAFGIHRSLHFTDSWGAEHPLNRAPLNFQDTSLLPLWPCRGLSCAVIETNWISSSPLVDELGNQGHVPSKMTFVQVAVPRCTLPTAPLGEHNADNIVSNPHGGDGNELRTAPREPMSSLSLWI